MYKGCWELVSVPVGHGGDFFLLSVFQVRGKDFSGYWAILLCIGGLGGLMCDRTVDSWGSQDRRPASAG